MAFCNVNEWFFKRFRTLCNGEVAPRKKGLDGGPRIRGDGNEHKRYRLIDLVTWVRHHDGKDFGSRTGLPKGSELHRFIGMLELHKAYATSRRRYADNLLEKVRQMLNIADSQGRELTVSEKHEADFLLDNRWHFYYAGIKQRRRLVLEVKDLLCIHDRPDDGLR